MFGKDWEPGRATIVAVRLVPDRIGGGHRKAEFVADVAPEGPAAPFRATFTESIHVAPLDMPQVGEVVAVRFDAGSGDVRFDAAERRNREDVTEQREQDAFDAIAHAPVGAAAPTEPPITQALSEVSALTDRMAVLSAHMAATTEAFAAIKAARAAGDDAEVARLKAAFQRTLDATEPPAEG